LQKLFSLFISLTLAFQVDAYSDKNLILNESQVFSSARPLIVGYVDFQPLYSTVNNKPQGMLSDITHKVFNDLDLNFKEQSMPTKRLFSSLKKGRVQIWCGIKVDSLQTNVWSGNEVLHHLSLNLYSLSKSGDIAKKSDLKGKTIILLLGYSYGGWGQYIRNKKNEINFIDVKSHDDALRLIKTGRYQYLLNYRAPMNIALKKSPSSELKQQNISHLPIVFNVTKNMASSKLLLSRLDNSLAKLIKAGEIVIQ